MNPCTSPSLQHPWRWLVPPTTKTARGFTLFELLIVIGIIAILAALLIPGVKWSVSNARSLKCSTNLRQIAAATLLYASDNDGKMPTAISSPDPSTSGGDVWIKKLDPYVPIPKAGVYGKDNVFFCPEGLSPRDWANSATDYACNDRIDTVSTTGVFAQQAWGVWQENVRVSQISSPSRVLLAADAFYASDVRHGCWGVGLGGLENATYFGKPTLPSKGIAPRHFFQNNPVRGKFNAAFCDGHVETFSWDDPRLQDKVFRKQLVDTQ